jgi:hypothetical protein
LKSTWRLHEALTTAWPRLSGGSGSGLLASKVCRSFTPTSSRPVHASGHLTDVVLERAIVARARVAVLPCCHDLDVNDAGDLTGWIEGPLAVDVVRAMRLQQYGYRI